MCSCFTGLLNRSKVFVYINTVFISRLPVQYDFIYLFVYLFFMDHISMFHRWYSWLSLHIIGSWRWFVWFILFYLFINFSRAIFRSIALNIPYSHFSGLEIHGFNFYVVLNSYLTHFRKIMLEGHEVDTHFDNVF